MIYHFPHYMKICADEKNICFFSLHTKQGDGILDKARTQAFRATGSCDCYVELKFTV